MFVVFALHVGGDRRVRRQLVAAAARPAGVLRARGAHELRAAARGAKKRRREDGGVIAPAPTTAAAAGTGVPEHERVVFAEKRHRYCVAVFVINEGERVRKQLRRDGGARRHRSTSSSPTAAAPTDRSRRTRSPIFGCARCSSSAGPGKLSAQMRMAIGFALDEGYDGIVVIDGNGKDDTRRVPRFISNCSTRATITCRARATFRAARHQHAARAERSAVRLLHAPLISLAARHALHGHDKRLPRVQPASARRSARRAAARRVRRTTSCTTISRFAPRDSGFRVIETPVTRRYPASGKDADEDQPGERQPPRAPHAGGGRARTIRSMTTGRGANRRSSATPDSSAEICCARRPFDALFNSAEHRRDRRSRASI